MAGRVAPYIDNTGLVFAYDLANVNRSYLGEPTVNYCSADSNLVANIDCSTANATAVLPSRDIGTVRRVTVVADTYGGIIRASLTHNLPSSGIPQAGQSYTISCWIRNSSGVAVAAGWEPEVGQPDGYLRPNVESGFNGNYAASSQPNTLSSNWTRVSYTYSYTSTQTSQIIPFIYFGHPVGGSGSGIGATIDFYQIQIEVKSHATPYTTGTRSVTQGLKDLTGRSTIDLSNVSFDSSAQMTFDGTDDYINLGSSDNWKIGQNGTIEAVVRREAAVSTNHRLWCVYNNSSHLDTYIDAATGGLYMHGGTVGTNTQVPLNQYLHIIVRYESGNITIWYNGVSQSLTGTTSGYNINGTSYTELFLGRYVSSSGYRWAGAYPIFRLYNRALTASEIQQNFNAVRGRYGI